MGEAKKRTGRPPASEEKRTRFVNVRFTEAEVKLLTGLEKELGLSRTDYIRRQALEKVEIMMVNSTELINKLDRIGTELGRSGNNINQLVRHANALDLKGRLDQEVIKLFNSLFVIYLKQQRQVERTLRSILRQH
jgi:hypothetical protein